MNVRWAVINRLPIVVAGVIQLVECQLPKLDVAGSSPVARSGNGCQERFVASPPDHDKRFAQAVKWRSVPAPRVYIPVG
jgi:hypothetical protein